MYGVWYVLYGVCGVVCLCMSVWYVYGVVEWDRCVCVVCTRMCG